MIKTLVVIATSLIACIICYNDGYDNGFMRGQIDGRITEIVRCIADIAKVQREFKCQK